MAIDLLSIGFALSFLGDPRVWIAVSIILFASRMAFRFQKKQKLLWARAFIVFVGISMGLAFLSSYVLKDIYHLPRPCSSLPSGANYIADCPTDFSFPSGHATTGFAAATGLFLISRKKLRGKAPIFYLVGILPAIGRVLQGVHTIADVAAGAVLGIVFSAVFYFVIIHLYNRFKK